MTLTEEIRKFDPAWHAANAAVRANEPLSAMKVAVRKTLYGPWEAAAYDAMEWQAARGRPAPRSMFDAVRAAARWKRRLEDDHAAR
ncbi:hypothetical protein [Paludisphaera mucosa]|uniref:Uncharacterized protein n=1 Tax=Paludisphaera mucosa TaxID=3030827 RepID=A0ABT6F618_9BACT|nr:hypothetical protein [Paludisphaera mucosa]MDG3002854.1 hypothetical protein [Paludisphaera mucosa]